VHLCAPVVTTTSVILGFNKILNGDILVLACPGKWLLNKSCRHDDFCSVLSTVSDDILHTVHSAVVLCLIHQPCLTGLLASEDLKTRV